MGTRRRSSAPSDFGPGVVTRGEMFATLLTTDEDDRLCIEPASCVTRQARTST
jgi:hypothetical protein